MISATFPAVEDTFRKDRRDHYRQRDFLVNQDIKTKGESNYVKTLLYHS